MYSFIDFKIAKSSESKNFFFLFKRHACYLAMAA